MVDTSDIAAIIQDRASQAGADPSYVSRLFQIESGNNPSAITGSNQGIGQFGPAEQSQYGITDPTDVGQQTDATIREAIVNSRGLAQALGRQPTPGELYLAHQQGLGGAIAHLTNPDQPAWQSMASTGEGRQKGANWARQAIWGNIPDNAKISPTFNKSMFPDGVDSVTSGQFAQGWVGKFERGLPGATATAVASNPQSAPAPFPSGVAAPPGTQTALAPGGANPFAGLAVSGQNQPQAEEPDDIGAQMAQIVQQRMQEDQAQQQSVPQLPPIHFAMTPGMKQRLLSYMQYRMSKPMV